MARELDIIEANRGLSYAQIAAQLGRTMASVVGAVIYYGLSRPKLPRCKWEKRLFHYYRQGFSDREIAGKMGCSRATVQRRRRILGLSANPLREGVMRKRYQQQLRSAEVGSLADLRWLPQRLAALSRAAKDGDDE